MTTITSITAGSRVTIEYHAIDFKTHPEKRQYRYRVYESTRNTPYNPPTKATSFDWTPKKPDDYFFEVQAIDRDLNYSEPARVSLKISPPWYKNGWIAMPVGGAIFTLLSSSIFFGSCYYAKRREAQRLQNHLFEQEKQARETLEERNTELERALRQAKWGITTIRGLAHNLKNATVWISRHCDFIRAGNISEGLAFLKEIKAFNPTIKVIVVTGASNEKIALTAVESGAYDFVRKDTDSYMELPFRVNQAYEKLQLELELKQVKQKKISQIGGDNRPIQVDCRYIA